MIYLSQPSLEIKISQPVLFMILPFFIKSISSDPQLYGGKLQNIPFISHNDFLEFCIPSFVKVDKIRRCKVFHKLCSSYFLFIFILQSSSWEFRMYPLRVTTFSHLLESQFLQNIAGLLCLFVKHCCVPFLQCYYKPASHSVNQFGLTFVCLSCLYFYFYFF